jgi:hypothetical protein
MLTPARILPAVAVLALAGCGGAPQAPTAASAPKGALEPKITQLYAPEPTVAAGESAKICYGVENAKTVVLSPPTQELSAALARCVEVEPKATTTYTLAVEGGEGKRVTQDITISVGAARAKIVNVNISALEVKRGDTVSVCYTVSGAKSVSITPPGYHAGSANKGCATHQPVRDTTYTVAVTGASGDHDQEQVTVKVR